MSYPANLDDLPVDATDSETLFTMHDGTGHVPATNAMLLWLLELGTKLGTGAATPTAADDVLYVSGAGATAYGKKGLVKIGDAAGTGASGVITFSSIPATYRELQATIYGRSSAAGPAVQCQMTINGDTTAGDYDSEWGLVSATTPSAIEHIGDVGYIDVGNFPGSNSTANLHSSTKLWFPEYAQTAGWKIVQFLTANALTLVTGNLTPRYGMGVLESTAAISSLTFTLASGNWTTASRITLWGVMA